MAAEAEVVKSGQTGVVLYDTNMFGELRWQDPAEIGLRAGKRIDGAQSADDLFDVMTGNTASKLVGKVLEIREVDFIAYQADDGVIPNGICTAVDTGSGEVLEFSVTSLVCTHQLKKAQIMGWLPWKVRITEVQTRNNQKALNFERP
jgi:hypothetical protein